jgi:hypothetical protein
MEKQMAEMQDEKVNRTVLLEIPEMIEVQEMTVEMNLQL